MTDHPIPEEYRRRALYAALYHHDDVNNSVGGECDGDPIRAEFRAGASESARRYVKRVAGALGFSYASEGPLMVVLRPDTEHALAGLRGEYDEVEA